MIENVEPPPRKLYTLSPKHDNPLSLNRRNASYFGSKHLYSPRANLVNPTASTSMNEHPVENLIPPSDFH